MTTSDPGDNSLRDIGAAELADTPSMLKRLDKYAAHRNVELVNMMRWQWLAMAERCRDLADSNPGGLFRTLISSRGWKQITADQLARGRRRYEEFLAAAIEGGAVP